MKNDGRAPTSGHESDPNRPDGHSGINYFSLVRIHQTEIQIQKHLEPGLHLPRRRHFHHRLQPTRRLPPPQKKPSNSDPAPQHQARARSPSACTARWGLAGMLHANEVCASLPAPAPVAGTEPTGPLRVSCWAAGGGWSMEAACGERVCCSPATRATSLESESKGKPVCTGLRYSKEEPSWGKSSRTTHPMLTTQQVAKTTISGGRVGGGSA